MARASRSSTLLPGLLRLLPLLLLGTTTRALGPRISVRLGECCGALQREEIADRSLAA